MEIKPDEIASILRQRIEGLDTGEADPNNIMLTPGQRSVLEADIVALNAEIDALCSAHDVEPVEEVEEPEPEEE